MVLGRCIAPRVPCLGGHRQDIHECVCVCKHTAVHTYARTCLYRYLFSFIPFFFHGHKFILLLLLLLSHISRVRLCATPQMAEPIDRFLCPWDSPGKNTGVGCHFLLQCMKVKSESEVAQSCPTLHDPMDCSPPGSSVHGIFQARVLEWGAFALSEINTRTSSSFLPFPSYLYVPSFTVRTLALSSINPFTYLLNPIIYLVYQS